MVGRTRVKKQQLVKGLLALRLPPKAFLQYQAQVTLPSSIQNLSQTPLIEPLTASSQSTGEVGTLRSLTCGERMHMKSSPLGPSRDNFRGHFHTPAPENIHFCRELRKAHSCLWKDNCRRGDLTLPNSLKYLKGVQTFARKGEDPELILSSTLLDGYSLSSH